MAFLNDTGLSRLVSHIKSSFALVAHTHDMSDVETGDLNLSRTTGTLPLSSTTGTLALNRGGTGATTASAARTAIGAAASSHNHDASNISSGTLPIARGGTGGTTAADARSALGAASTATATTSAKGLMSASDKTKLDDTKARVIEEGSSGNWKYRKWSNGWAECWQTISKSLTSSSWGTWGGLYQHSISVGAYPFEFVGWPTVSVTAHPTTGNYGAFAGSWQNGSLSSCPNVTLIRPSASGSETYKIGIYVIGWWR